MHAYRVGHLYSVGFFLCVTFCHLACEWDELFTTGNNGWMQSGNLVEIQLLIDSLWGPRLFGVPG